MDAKTIWTLVQIVAGVVVIVSGGFGWYYGEKESKEKDARYDRQLEELLDRAKRAEEASKELNAETKGIRELVAQRYPGVGFEEAIDRLRKDLGEELKATRELATRNEYRPLSSDIRARVVGQLKPLTSQASARGILVRLFVVAHRHDDERERLLQAMRAVLVEAGLRVEVMGEQILIGGSVGNPIAIGFHSQNQDISAALAEALQPLIGMPVPATKDDQKFAPTEIHIKLSGRPQFSADGTVTLR